MRPRPVLSCLAAVAATVLLSACASTPMHTAHDEGWNHFGEAGHDSGAVVALGAIGGGESGVIVEGTIIDVCPKKGCWMRVRDDEDHELFVRFKDYGFFVPMNAAGHRVALHGMAESKLSTVEELQHYAQDAGKSAEEIAAITEPELRITFYADSVYIEGTDLDPPHSE